MGMFDYVEYEANCENCGKPLRDFQSKDSHCLMDTIQPSEVDGFYTSCAHCMTWHDFIVDRVCAANSITVKMEKTERN